MNKRPDDPIELAKLIGDIATRQDHDKNPAAAALGKLGGEARASKLSAERRSAIAKKAAKVRWRRKK